jgi:tyrosinase
VNLPGATPQTPTEDPHYAGSFAFFTDPRHAMPSGAGAFTVDLTETIRRLGPTGLTDAVVSVQLVAVPMREGAAPTDSFSVRRMSLELAHVREKE